MTGDKEFHHEYGMKNGHAPIADKVVLVDFDGTLFPWGPLMNWEAKPLPGAVDAMRAFNYAGLKISIFTSRMSERWLEHSGNDRAEQYEYVWKMCTSWGIPFNEIIGEKVPAIAYIDDKGIEFTGKNWPEIQKRLVPVEDDEKDVERTVTTDSLKVKLHGSSDVGHSMTGTIKRDGDTFEDKQLGKEWNESFDTTEALVKKVEKGSE